MVEAKAIASRQKTCGFVAWLFEKKTIYTLYTDIHAWCTQCDTLLPHTFGSEKKKKKIHHNKRRMASVRLYSQIFNWFITGNTVFLACDTQADTFGVSVTITIRKKDENHYWLLKVMKSINFSFFLSLNSLWFSVPCLYPSWTLFERRVLAVFSMQSSSTYHVDIFVTRATSRTSICIFAFNKSFANWYTKYLHQFNEANSMHTDVYIHIRTNVQHHILRISSSHLLFAFVCWMNLSTRLLARFFVAILFTLSKIFVYAF